MAKTPPSFSLIQLLTQLGRVAPLSTMQLWQPCSRVDSRLKISLRAAEFVPCGSASWGLCSTPDTASHSSPAGQQIVCKPGHSSLALGWRGGSPRLLWVCAARCQKYRCRLVVEQCGTGWRVSSVDLHISLETDDSWETRRIQLEPVRGRTRAWHSTCYGSGLIESVKFEQTGCQVTACTLGLEVSTLSTFPPSAIHP